MRRHLPERGTALEVASGTGQHVTAFARAFPGIAWTPSDPDPEARRSVAAWRAEAGLANIAAPLDIDVTIEDWHDGLPGPYDVMVAVNLLHISPWRASQGLMAGAGALLAPKGMLYIYGCFKRDGAHISDSNVAFDAALRRQNGAWGVRDIADVEAEAAARGLALIDVVAMPANNLSLILGRHEAP